MKQLRYWGEFVSVKGVAWRIEIHQDGEFVQEEIFFPPSPLEIEWKCDGGKMGNLHTSAATLTVESDTDRRFIDLYQVEVGAVLLKVYREGCLYWCGTMDTELYEEPYSYTQNYDVTLTFADFAPLERLKWKERGFMSVGEIIDHALQGAQIEYSNIIKHISTRLYERAAQSLTLNELPVMGENWFDEQGEPMTVYQVLEEVLKPLALHIIQKNGKVIIFDTNALYGTAATAVVWDSTDAILSVDEVFNNVRVTFSPYGDSEIINEELDEKKTASDAWFETKVMIDYAQDNGTFANPEGFTFYVGEKSDSDIELSNGAKFFRIKSEYSGNDEAGIVMAAQTKHTPSGDYYHIDNLRPASMVFSQGVVISKPIIKLPSRYIASSPDAFLESKIKITLETLFDVRYNPFEQVADDNEQGNWDDLQAMCNIGYVPIMLTIRDADGKALYHYANRGVLNSKSYKNTGSWIAGEATPGECFLCYYDDDRASSSGFGGWKRNKPIIGAYTGEIPSATTRLGDGEYIIMPPQSGWLELTICDGIHTWKPLIFGEVTYDIYLRIRWLMYKNPKFEIVKRNGRAYQCDDVEYSAFINKDANEELEISTVVGTLKEPYATARGQILDEIHKPVSTLHRAGVTDLAEKLLIGTAYSCHAGRFNKLSGTVELLSDFSVLADNYTEGKYLVVSELQKPYSDESEVVMVEFAGDNYEGIEYEEV